MLSFLIAVRGDEKILDVILDIAGIQVAVNSVIDCSCTTMGLLPDT